MFWDNLRTNKLLRGEAWFTNGLKTSVGTGAGIYASQIGLEVSLSLGRHVTTLQVEIAAIRVSVPEMRSRVYENR